MEVIYYGNDNILEARELTNAASGDYVNDATVTVTLETADGVEVTGDTWPKAMGYVSGSDGKYRATLLDTLTITVGTKYVAKISANAGADLQGYWEVTLRCKMRTEDEP
jgi:hypothetical protein